MSNSYNHYKEKIIELLVKNPTWEDGIWKCKGKETPKKHILPLRNKINNSVNRAEAIKQYLGFDCAPYFPTNFAGLHQYAHHLTSSQTLCLQFFSKLIDSKSCATKEMVCFIKKAFGIDIHVGAECHFEYTERKNPTYMFDSDKDGNLVKAKGKYEGTSFDFHIKDKESPIEIYFEIKFTEDGFKKEKEDPRHLAKASEYLRIAPEFLKDKVATPQDFLKQYQIYRNIIRATDSNKYVVFISDENNPATKADIDMMDDFGLPQNILFKTWQQLIPEYMEYPYELPLPLKAIQKFK